MFFLTDNLLIAVNRQCLAHCLIVSTLFSPYIVFAADQLDNITVISSTRTEKQQEDAPVRVEVVSEETIERIHARDLKEALEDIPGLVLKPIHGKSGYGVWLQGFDSNRVLVLIDGQPVSASTGSTVDLTQIALADIERIEIVKGAASALYGSAAMGGVINVITRKPEGNAWSLTLDGGSWDEKDLDDSSAVPFRHGKGHLSIEGNKWTLLMAGDVRDSDGYDLDKRTFSTQGDEGTKSSINARLGFQPNKNSEIYIYPSYYKEDIRRRFATPAPGTQFGEIRKNKNEIAERQHITLGGHIKTKNKAKFSGYALYETFEDDTQQDVIATPQIDQERHTKIDSHKLELQWDQPLGERQLITAGLVYFDEALEQNQNRFQGSNQIVIVEIGEGSERDNQEFFLQDDIFLSDTLELVVGGRYQDDSDFGVHFAPKINLLYSPDWSKQFETRIRAAVGTGYRVPNLKERYFVFDHSALGYMVLGNPDLQPEKSLSLQLGAGLSADKFSLDANLFYNDIDDLIETDIAEEQNIPGVRVFEYTNIAEAKTQGIELQWVQSLANQFRLNTAYTWLKSENKKTGNILPERPEHQIKASLLYEYQPWGMDVTLIGIYQSEEFVDADNNIESPDWMTWDLKINKKLNDHFKLFAGIDNFLDEHREHFDGTDFRPREGRLYYAGIRIDG